MKKFETIIKFLSRTQKTWLITGAAGFIGSNLLEHLLKLNQKVIGIDNFATGHQYNLDEVRSLVTAEQWSRFTFIEGDIRKQEDCTKACAGVDYVLHQAALGSVPRSINDPITTDEGIAKAMPWYLGYQNTLCIMSGLPHSTTRAKDLPL